MNTITVVGNVGRDPEIRYTASNMAVLKFSVADTRGKDDKKQTSWHNIVCFGEQAEAVANSIGKGKRVMVVGRLQVDSYEKKDGSKGTKVEIVADEVGVSVRFAAGDSPVKKLASDFGATIEEEELF
jgi:single-strand DNA-binding protein